METKRIGTKGTMKKVKDGFTGKRVNAGRPCEITGYLTDRNGNVWGYQVNVIRKDRVDHLGMSIDNFDRSTY